MIMGFDFLENISLNAILDNGGDLDLLITGGVVTITDPREVEYIKRLEKSAARMRFNHRETMDYIRYDLLYEY